MPLATLTFYGPDAHTASGRPYGGNRIAAPHRFAFGTTILFTAPSGRTLRAVVADRGGAIRGNRYDLPVRTFARLFGPGWRKAGVLHARYRVIHNAPERRHAARLGRGGPRHAR